jgi:hypothetical protein
MKTPSNRLIVLLALAAVLLLPLGARASTTPDFVAINPFPFDYTNHPDASIGESQFKMLVTYDSADAHAITFEFKNTPLSGAPSSITAIYFYDGTLFEGATATFSYPTPGVTFKTDNVTPGQLPGIGNYFGVNNNPNGPLPTYLVFSADSAPQGAESGSSPNGINPGEALRITFSNLPYTADGILAALGLANPAGKPFNTGSLVVGLIAQSVGENNLSFDYVDNPTATFSIPVPPTVWLLGSGLVGLGLLGWRRKRG